MLNRRICSTFITFFLFLLDRERQNCATPYTIFIQRTHTNPYWVNNIDGFCWQIVWSLFWSMDFLALFMKKKTTTIAIRQSINISIWTKTTVLCWKWYFSQIYFFRAIIVIINKTKNWCFYRNSLLYWNKKKIHQQIKHT